MGNFSCMIFVTMVNEPDATRASLATPIRTPITLSSARSETADQSSSSAAMKDCSSGPPIRRAWKQATNLKTDVHVDPPMLRRRIHTSSVADIFQTAIVFECLREDLLGQLPVPQTCSKGEEAARQF